MSETGTVSGQEHPPSSRRRIEGQATALSWIPMQAVEGASRVPFDLSLVQYDAPPPDRITGIDHLLRLNRDGRVRVVNHLTAWIDVDGGTVMDYGQGGESMASATVVRLGNMPLAFLPVGYPDIRPAPEVRDDSVRFVQTAGARTGMPFPRVLGDRRRVRVEAPTAWTTVALTLHADGRRTEELIGASPFPRHWLYDSAGEPVAKSGLIDYKEWTSHGALENSPWEGGEQSALVARAASLVERRLSELIVESDRRWLRLAAGEVLFREGDLAEEVYLVFDGIVSVTSGGKDLAELGPGAVVGEMGVLAPEGARRRGATVTAASRCRIAAIPAGSVNRELLERLAESRQGGEQSL